MNIPTKLDWNYLPNDLDANVAFKHFFGKSFGEAVKLFEENASVYQEDLMWMPPIPFNFYALAFAEYLNSEKAAGDSDGALSFMGMFTWWLETRKHRIDKDTGELLFNTAEKISQNQKFYDADPQIYGEFSQLFEKIKTLVYGT